MRLIDLDEFLRQNCVDRMEGKSCEECNNAFHRDGQWMIPCGAQQRMFKQAERRRG